MGNLASSVAMSFASRSHSTLCQLYLGGGSVLVGEMSIVVIIGKWSVLVMPRFGSVQFKGHFA